MPTVPPDTAEPPALHTAQKRQKTLTHMFIVNVVAWYLAWAWWYFGV